MKIILPQKVAVVGNCYGNRLATLCTAMCNLLPVASSHCLEDGLACWCDDLNQEYVQFKRKGRGRFLKGFGELVMCVVCRR